MRREIFIVYTSVSISKAEKLELLIILLSLSLSHSHLTPAACRIPARDNTAKTSTGIAVRLTTLHKAAQQLRLPNVSFTVLLLSREQIAVEVRPLPLLQVQLIRS